MVCPHEKYSAKIGHELFLQSWKQSNYSGAGVINCYFDILQCVYFEMLRFSIGVWEVAALPAQSPTLTSPIVPQGGAASVTSYDMPAEHTLSNLPVHFGIEFYWRLTAPSTSQGHLRAFPALVQTLHKSKKSNTAWREGEGHMRYLRG